MNATISNPSGRNAVTRGWHDPQAIGTLEQLVPQVAPFFGGGDSWFHTHNGVVELLNLLEDRGLAVVRKSPST